MKVISLFHTRSWCNLKCNKEKQSSGFKLSEEDMELIYNFIVDFYPSWVLGGRRDARNTLEEMHDVNFARGDRKMLQPAGKRRLLEAEIRQVQGEDDGGGEKGAAVATCEEKRGGSGRVVVRRRWGSV
ncbi:hypothetical protein DM860_017349 [Cuscuta australis]|uniref:Uncharacterized protein n=1 Tax=Cuscuta australis TaxID=267555 RepID=A0A328DDM1_9ASTE|nr:hypothetical protein DM860_017349 [Cuscuta australis]